MVTRLCHACHFTTTHNGHGAWYMSHGHLVAMFLYFNFLKFNKFGATRLQVQTSACFVNTTIIWGAFLHRYKCKRIHWLICLGTATITCVCSHNHHRFNFCATRYNTAYGYQFSNMLRFNLTYRLSLFIGVRFESHFTKNAIKQIKYEVICNTAFILQLLLTSASLTRVGNCCVDHVVPWDCVSAIPSTNDAQYTHPKRLWRPLHAL